MVKKKIKEEFRVTISNCGTSYSNRTYGKMSGKCALEVCNTALINMIKMMVGEENINKSLYLISLYHLKELHDKFDEKFPELKNSKIEESLKYFKIKEDD